MLLLIILVTLQKMSKNEEQETYIKEFTGETVDFPRAILRTKKLISGKKPMNSVCVIEKSHRWGCALQEDRDRADALYTDAGLGGLEDQEEMEKNVYNALMRVFGTKAPLIINKVSGTNKKAGSQLFDALQEQYNPDIEGLNMRRRMRSRP